MWVGSVGSVSRLLASGGSYTPIRNVIGMNFDRLRSCRIPEVAMTMEQCKEGRMLQVAIPIFKDMTALDLVGPYEVLHTLPTVTVVFVSHSVGLYAANGGMLSIQATASLDEVPNPDIIVVPGGYGTQALLNDEALLNWIRKAHETSLYTTSVCTGSLLLAAAGLLKGVEATTHWNAYEVLERFGAKPTAARVVKEGKIITSAGVSSGIDLGIKLVALLSDETTAKAAELLIEYDPEPPYNTGSVAKAAKAGPEVMVRALELAKAARAAPKLGTS